MIKIELFITLLNYHIDEDKKKRFQYQGLHVTHSKQRYMNNEYDICHNNYHMINIQ